MKAIFLLFVCLNTFAQSGPKIGQRVPKVNSLPALNYPSAYININDIHNKIIILDFWATWCAPCVSTLPSLEKIQKKFHNDLQVITVSDESKVKVDRFIKQRNINLPVILDSTLILAKSFPHRIIPHTVVIGRDGCLKAITSADKLTEEVVSKLINNESVNLKQKKDVLNFNQFVPLSGMDNLTYQLVVTPYKEGLPSMANITGNNSPYKNRRILAVNLSPASLYEIAYQMPISFRTIDSVKYRINFEWNEKNAVCYDLIVPRYLADERFAIMQQNLATMFPYRTQLEKHMREVKVLRRISKSDFSCVDSVGEKDIQYLPDKLVFHSVTMHDLSRFLEDEIHVPIVDETGLTTPFDLVLEYSTGDIDALNRELNKNNLQLIDTNRLINMLAIYDR